METKFKYPDELGHFGIYGGIYVSETLMPAILELERAYAETKNDPLFKEEFDNYLRTYVGRPTPLYFAKRMTEELGGAKIYLKREDLAHTGAHKINNTICQALLALRMNKRRIIAETGAGQHGVATATVAALLNMECEIFMGLEDTKITNVRNTFYIIGSVAGPHPYPMIVRDFQSIIGKETKKQIIEEEGRLPDLLIACVGGGSNAMGLFYPFIEENNVKMIGVEAAGEGLDTAKHSASISKGRVGVLHGSKTYLLQDQNGQVSGAHSIAAGLDYPGVGPEHSYLNDSGKVLYDSVTDREAINAFSFLSKKEGIIPALESSHAIAHTIKVAPQMSKDSIIVINLSGRGDKDLDSIAKYIT